LKTNLTSEQKFEVANQMSNFFDEIFSHDVIESSKANIPGPETILNSYQSKQLSLRLKSTAYKRSRKNSRHSSRRSSKKSEKLIQTSMSFR
jgi:hypothetical protein